jgi:glycosyltransferase 2 family protein
LAAWEEPVLKKARFWIGILISLIALAFAFRQVRFAEVWAALAGVNYWLLAASLLPLILFLVLRAFRWRLLFYPQKGLHLLNLFAVINIGYLLSNIFPARLGDVARAYLIGDTEEVSRTAAFSTIVAERVLDALCAVGGFFLVLLVVSVAQPPATPLPDWMIRSGLTVGAAALVAVALFVVLVRQRAWTLRLLVRVLRALHWPDCETMARFWERLASRTRLRFLAHLPWADRSDLEKMADSLIDGLSGITTLRLGPPLLVWSVAIWAVISAFYWIVLLAFDPSQPFVAGLAVASVTALGMTIPSSPGFIGVFEFLGRETIVLFGMRPEEALSCALVAHVVVYVVYTLLGLASMAQQNLTYAQIQKRISAEAQTSS